MGLNNNTNPLPGVGYTGSVIVQRNRESKNINGVYYVDNSGNWVEYGGGNSGTGHYFNLFTPTVTETIANNFTISVEEVTNIV